MKTLSITLFNFIGATIVLNMRGRDTMIVLIIVFVGLGVLDTITGYFKNKKEDRKSTILGRGIMFRVVKLIFIFLLLLLTSHKGYIFEEYQYMIGAIPMIVMLGRIATEIKSIAENIEQMGINDPTFKKISTFIDKITEAFHNAFQESFDYFIKKITQYVSKSADKERNSMNE